MFQNFFTEFTAETASGLSALILGLVFLGFLFEKLPPAAVGNRRRGGISLVGIRFNGRNTGGVFQSCANYNCRNVHLVFGIGKYRRAGCCFGLPRQPVRKTRSDRPRAAPADSCPGIRVDEQYTFGNRTDPGRCENGRRAQHRFQQGSYSAVLHGDTWRNADIDRHFHQPVD